LTLRGYLHIQIVCVERSGNDLQCLDNHRERRAVATRREVHCEARGVVFWPDRCIYRFMARANGSPVQVGRRDGNPVRGGGTCRWECAPRGDFDARGAPAARGTGFDDALEAGCPDGGADAASGSDRRRRGGLRGAAGVWRAGRRVLELPAGDADDHAVGGGLRRGSRLGRRSGAGFRESH
jgi:hypothetical protein